MTKTWTTKKGEEIPYNKLEDSHLLNIISFIERKAEEGITVKYGGMGMWGDEPWFDVGTYYGEEARDRMDYNSLKAEAKKRGLITKSYEVSHKHNV